MTKKLAAFSITLLLAFALCASAAWSSDDFINSTQGYGVGVWWNTVYGDVTYGTKLNLRGDLGLKNGKPALNLDAEWKLNDKWGIGLNYFHSRHDGDSTAVRNQVFNGAQILAGDKMSSRLTLDTISVLAKYNLYRSEDSTLNVLGGAKFISADLSITKQATVNPVLAPRFNFTLKPSTSFYPALGLSGKQRIADRVHIYGDFTGMFDVGGGNVKNGYFMDFRGGLRYNFQHPGWYLTFDYRTFGSRVERNNGNKSRIWWNGPAVTLRYEF